MIKLKISVRLRNNAKTEQNQNLFTRRVSDQRQKCVKNINDDAKPIHIIPKV